MRIPAGQGPRFPIPGSVPARQNEYHRKTAIIVSRVCKICSIPPTATFGLNPNLTMDPAVQKSALITAFFKEFVHRTWEFSSVSARAHEKSLQLDEFKNLDQALKDPNRFPALLDIMIDLHMLAFQEMIKQVSMPYITAYLQLFSALDSCEDNLRVLAIGAGLAGETFLMSKDYPRRHPIFLLDNDPVVFQFLVEMRKKLGSKANGNVRLIKGDFFDHSGQGGPYDILFANLVLRQIPKEKRPLFFAKARLLLPAGGKLLVSDSISSLDDKELEEEIQSLSSANRFTTANCSRTNDFGMYRSFNYILEAV